MKEVGRDIKRTGQDMTEVGGQMTRAITLPLAAIGGGALKAATDFQSSFAGIRKTVDATEEQFAELSAGMRGLSKDIPINVNGLNRIGEAAGQLGIETENILSFTRTMADLGVTTNLAAEEAATQLARLANITGMPQSQFDRLGSTIVELGNNLATTEAEIVDMGLRLAGIGTQVGLTEAQILGMAGAMSSLGVRSESGGTAMTKTLATIQTAVVQAGDDLNRFASVAGVSAQEFADIWSRSPVEALKFLLDGLAQLEDSTGAMDELGLAGIRVQDTLRRMAKDTDLLTESTELGSDAWRENTALTKEAQQRYNTFASRVKLLINRLRDAAITLGDALIPVVEDLIPSVERTIDKLAELATQFAELDPRTQKIVLGVAAMVAAAGPLLVVAGGLISAFGAVSGALGSLGITLSGVIAFITGPAGWIAAGAALLLAWKPARDFFVDFAKNNLSLIGKAIKAVAGFVGGLISKLKEWWSATRETRRFLVELHRVIATDIIGAIRTAVKWLIEIQSKIRAWAAEILLALPPVKNFILGLKILRAGLVFLWEAFKRGLEIIVEFVEDSVERLVEWVDKMGGIVRVLGLFNPALGMAAQKMQEWVDEAKRNIDTSDDLISTHEALKDITEDGASMQDAMTAAANAEWKALEEAAAKADALREQQEKLNEATKEALKSIAQQTAESGALLDALIESEDAYATLNTLLDAGIPLNEALTGAYDDQAKKLNELNEALQKLEANRERQKDLAKQLKENEEELAKAMQGALGADLDQSTIIPEFPVLPIPGVNAVNEALAEMNRRAEEQRAQLAEVNRKYKEGEISLETANELAKKLGLNFKDAGSEFAKVVEQATENFIRSIQGEIADAIVDFVETGEFKFDELWDTFKSLALRAIAEIVAKWAATKFVTSFIGSGGGGGSGIAGLAGFVKKAWSAFTSGAWVSYVGTAALVGAAVFIAGKVYEKMTEASFEDVASFGISGGQGSGRSISDAGNAFVSGITEFVRQFEQATGGIIEEMPTITLRMKDGLKQFGVQIAGGVTQLFDSMEEALDYAIRSVISRSTISGLSKELTSALAEGSFRSVEQLQQVIGVFQELERRTLDPVAQEIRDVQREFAEMARILREAGVSAAVLGEAQGRAWQSIRDSITGVTKSARQQFDERMKVFNAELAAERNKLKQKLAVADAEKAAAAAEVERLKAVLAMLDATGKFAAEMIANLSRQLAQAEAALASSSAAAAAAQAALDNLPDPISPSEFRGDGRGGASEAQRNMDRLNETLEQMARARLPEAQQALAELEARFAELRILAGNNAEALARVNAEYEEQARILRQQLVEGVYKDIRAFEQGIGLSSFRSGIRQITSQADDLRERFMVLAEALDFGGERIARGLNRIARAERQRLQVLMRQEGQDLLLSALDFLGRTEEAERLRFELTKAELQIRYQELKIAAQKHDIEVATLAAIGGLVSEIADVDFEAWQRLQRSGGGAGGGGGGGGGADPRAEALRLLRQYQASALDPFNEAIRGVVDDFAQIRAALGWTAEVQRAYADAIQDVIEQQLEPLRRLQEELAFRSGSSLASIDQFRLAQSRLNEAMTAIRGGDFSQLQDLPDLARRVLDLNISAQGSEATAFLERMIDGFLQEAQDIARAAGMEIVPGSANDPFAWLRDTPTAGDQLIANTVRGLYPLQDDTTESIDRLGRDRLAQIEDGIRDAIAGFDRFAERPVVLPDAIGDAIGDTAVNRVGTKDAVPEGYYQTVADVLANVDRRTFKYVRQLEAIKDNTGASARTLGIIESGVA